MGVCADPEDRWGLCPIDHESAGVQDVAYMIRVMKAAFGS